MKHIKLYENWMSEDEMTPEMAPETAMAPPRGYVKSSLKELLGTRKDLSGFYMAGIENDFDYFASKKYIFRVLSGEVYEQAPGGLSPIRPINNLNKAIYMKEGGTADIDVAPDKRSRGDSYSLTCAGGKITIESTSTVGP